MKVLYATPSVDPSNGGPAYFVKSIARGARLKGADVCLLAKDAGYFSEDIPVQAENTLKSFDVIHNCGIWTRFNQNVAWHARRSGVPMVWSPMGMLEPWALDWKKWRKRFGWWAYQRQTLGFASVLHATAFSEAENLLRLGLQLPVAVIPHGIDMPDKIDLGKHGNSSLAGTRRLLFLSRINPKKGLLDLVAAWSSLRPKGWIVTVAGPDESDHRAEVERAVRMAGLECDFEFTGPVYGEQKLKLFATSDVFVLPTYSENFGLVVAEALAHGIPVLTTTGTPWSELETNRCGWWVPPGADSLVNTLKHVLTTSREELRDMGDRGRQMVEKNYSWSVASEKHMQKYLWLAGASARPDFIVS